MYTDNELVVIEVIDLFRIIYNSGRYCMGAVNQFVPKNSMPIVGDFNFTTTQGVFKSPAVSKVRGRLIVSSLPEFFVCYSVE